MGTSYLPSHSVPRVDFTLKTASDVLSLQRLSTIDDDASVISDLYRVRGRYESWSDELQATLPQIKPALADAAGRLLDRISTSIGRMRRGIDLLASDEHPEVRRAFALANRAMLMQMVHGSDDFAGKRKQWTAALPDEPDYTTRRCAQLASVPARLPPAHHRSRRRSTTRRIVALLT